jgi:chromosomal replication initiator protein
MTPDILLPIAYRHRKPIALHLIATAVATAYDLTVEELSRRTREERYVWPRQVAMYLVREISGEPWRHIGRSLGDRDHGTALHAHAQVRSRMDVYPELREAIDGLRAEIERMQT